jgi:hypothetical protein
MTTRKQKTIEQPKKNGSRKKSDKPSNFVKKKQHTCTGGSGKRLWGNTSDAVHRRRWYQDTK